MGKIDSFEVVRCRVRMLIVHADQSDCLEDVLRIVEFGYGYLDCALTFDLITEQEYARLRTDLNVCAHGSRNYYLEKDCALPFA